MTPPPFTLHRPAQQVAGILLTSPHSGRHYPQDLLDAARLNAKSLRSSEDAFVDELFAMAPALGLPLLMAEFPRAWCDANREKWELDPTMFADPLPDYVNTTSPRVAAGLGTIPRTVGFGQAIYKRQLYFHEAQARVETCWQPFHTALAEMIDECRRAFGHCLVLDCHSMPSMPGRHDRQTDMILGDGHGTTCAPALSAYIEASLVGLGFSVSRNKPYAGGFITRHYGRPLQGVQTIQIEIARELYMDERQITHKPAFTSICEQLGQFIRKLAMEKTVQDLCTPYCDEAAE